MSYLRAWTVLVVVALVAPGHLALAQRTDLVLGMTLEPPHLDPTGGAAAAIDEVVYANVFETLVRVDEFGTVQPALARDWYIADDGLSYTFRLNEGVTFHDGTPFESSHVIFSFERALAEDSTNAQKGYFEPIASMEAEGPYEVHITLAHPDGLFLFNMAQGDAAIVAPESAATNRTNPVGTGPFRFANWVQGDRVELVRYEDYWGEPPALERVTFRFIGDPAAQVTSLLAGDVHAYPGLAAPEALERFERDPRFRVVVGTTEGETILAVNHRRAPFDNLLVRRALITAIDRQAVVDGAYFGYGTPIGSHFAPHNPYYVDLVDVYPYDPEAARALLAEAGLPDGFRATLALPPTAYARRSGEIIQAQLARIGVAVELLPMEWAQWLEQVFSGFDYDMTIVAHTEPLDIGIYARGDAYYFGYQNPTFEALIERLNETVVPEGRAALYGAAQMLLAVDQAAIFLFQLPKLGVHAAGLSGLWANSPIQANDVTRVRWDP